MVTITVINHFLIKQRAIGKRTLVRTRATEAKIIFLLSRLNQICVTCRHPHTMLKVCLEHYVCAGRGLSCILRGSPQGSLAEQFIGAAAPPANTVTHRTVAVYGIFLDRSA